MKPLALAARPLPVRTRPSVTLPFPEGGLHPSKLRALRDRLYREGKHDLALGAAQEVARRDPGRESFFYVGFLCREVGRYREALKTLRDALRFRTGPAYLVPEIHLHIAYTWFLMGRRKEMGEHLRKAYSMRWKPRSAAKFHHMLGNEHFSKGRYRQALEEFARAEAAYGDDHLGRGRAATNLGMTCIRLGNFPAARMHLDRAIAIHKRHRHKADLAWARWRRGELHLDEKHFPRAYSMFIHAARAFRELGKRDQEAATLMSAGYAAVCQETWSQAKAALDRAVQVGAGTGRWDVLCRSYACRAIAVAHSGDMKAAEEDLERARRLLLGKRVWYCSLHLYRAQARIARRAGDWKAAWRWARRGERLARKVNDLPRIVEFRTLRAEAEEQLGRGRAALHARKAAERLEEVRSRAASSEVQERAAKLARSSLPLLLVGESGTGKTHLAREIHALSARSRGPLVVAPCEQMAFPASDLCGHVQGAWSGAREASGGYVGQAEGGTLVLDRVDELPPEHQRVLPRILDGWVRPVGGAEERRVDVRIVATCRSADRLIPELWRRFEGATIALPPLRDRRREIPALIERMLPGRRITPEAVAELAALPWEGNLAELRSALERLAAHSARGAIGIRLVRRLVKRPDSCRLGRLVDKKRQLAEMAAALA
jgi:tetratricopeptide (TPR) repeat protein